MSSIRLAAAGVIVAFSGTMSAGCTGLLCIACDGSLVIEGRVVGIQSAGSSDLRLGAHADSSLPEGAVGLQGCSVALGPWSPSHQPSAEEERNRSWQTETDQGGRFRVGGVSKPGTYPATVTVSCHGYRALRSGFVHDNQRPHQVVAVMFQ